MDDVRQDPRYLNWLPDTLSELVVPIIYQDRVVGVFDLESSALGRFTEEHVKVLTPLASQVAVALENARLYDEVVRRDERLNREMAIARRVQHGLFPEECPSGPGWEASAHFLPALELGGDLYDFYDMGEGLLGLAVGDVAGKGTAGRALRRLRLRHRARARVRAPPAGRPAPARQPHAAPARAGGLLLHAGLRRLRPEERRMTLANSGLPYPLHYRAGTGRAEAVELPGVAPGRLRRLHLRRADAGARVRRRFRVLHRRRRRGAAATARSTDARACARRSRRTRRCAPGRSARASSPTSTRFVGGATPADDVTLVVVKVL